MLSSSAFELAAIASLAYWGASLGGALLSATMMALAPAAMIVVWGRYAAPKASRRLSVTARIPLELSLLLLAAVALLAADRDCLAAVMAAPVRFRAAFTSQPRPTTHTQRNNMHAVVVNVTINDPAAAERALREQLVPRVSQLPGFVTGYWTIKDDTGLTMLIFESEDAANRMSRQAQTAVPPAMTFKDVEVREIAAHA